MPPAVGGGIWYTTVGGAVGAGCIPLPVPETHPDPYEIARKKKKKFIRRRDWYLLKPAGNFDESMLKLRETDLRVCTRKHDTDVN